MLIVPIYPEIVYPIEKALELKDFREMDYYAVSKYYLPIELMMENAGLHLARYVSCIIPKTKIIKIIPQAGTEQVCSKMGQFYS